MDRKSSILPSDWLAALWLASHLFVRGRSIKNHSIFLLMALPCYLGTTYPLDIVRSRLSIATASVPLSKPVVVATSSTMKHATLLSAYHTASGASLSPRPSAYTASELTMWGMTLKIVREEGGIRGLYRGLVTTAVGVAPYVGINFAAYEFLRGVITPPGKSSVTRKLTCGALAGEQTRDHYCVVCLMCAGFFQAQYHNH